jgi:hypothetical protein
MIETPVGWDRKEMKMEEIALKTRVSTPVDRDEIREVVDVALRHEADLAKARRAYFERTCRAFEQRYGMSSDEFLEQFESGALGDNAEYFDWYAAKRGLDLWERRFHILSGVQV